MALTLALVAGTVACAGRTRYVPPDARGLGPGELGTLRFSPESPPAQRYVHLETLDGEEEHDHR